MRVTYDAYWGSKSHISDVTEDRNASETRVSGGLGAERGAAHGVGASAVVSSFVATESVSERPRPNQSPVNPQVRRIRELNELANARERAVAQVDQQQWGKYQKYMTEEQLSKLQQFKGTHSYFS